MNLRNSVKLLGVLITSVLMSLNSFSQTSPDSVTCLPNSDLRAAAKLIAKGAIDSVELNIQRSNNKLLEQRLLIKEDIITQYKLKDNTYQDIMSNFKRESVVLLDQVALSNREVMRLQKKVKKQKAVTIIVGILGILGTGSALLLK